MDLKKYFKKKAIKTKYTKKFKLPSDNDDLNQWIKDYRGIGYSFHQWDKNKLWEKSYDDITYYIIDRYEKTLNEVEYYLCMLYLPYKHVIQNYPAHAIDLETKQAEIDKKAINIHENEQNLTIAQNNTTNSMHIKYAPVMSTCETL